MLPRLVLACLLAATALQVHADEKDKPRVNKLQYMYDFFYLPYSIDFRVGRDVETVLPYVVDPRSQQSRMIEAHELVTLDEQWSKQRSEWKSKSLLEFNTVAVGKSIRISQRLASHRVPVTRTAMDTLSVSDRMALTDTLKGKSPAVLAAFYQLRFLKSLMSGNDEKKFNFFIVSASWCESSREYRNLLEAYFKKFPDSKLVLHSLIVDDPKQEIFDSRLMKELFPHPKRYTQETVPRFLALQMVNGTPQIWEEGEALKELYDRFYAKHRGFLDGEAKLFQRSTASELDPKASASAK
ncbi:hypothetical protein K2X33_00535 [bacterium]|nr:hypothetical protein [bacterium]